MEVAGIIRAELRLTRGELRLTRGELPEHPEDV